jgi:NAD(P)-dependent dehydrogenase (short-subunit alcohol dehydrogenase family)
MINIPDTTGRLSGKCAIVTGGATGIGEAIAHTFAQQGAMVIVNGLPGDPVEDVARSICQHGGKAAGYVGDVTQAHHAEACIKAALTAFGRLNVVVNNAGVFLFTGETQDYPDDLAEQTIRMNILSAYQMTRHSLPHLQQSHGNLIYAGSEAGKVGLANNTVYGGTKAFLHAFCRGVAVEQAKYGVRANCVCPGAVDTAWTRKETGPMDRQMEKQIIAATPLGRRGTPEEIANVYAFLASDEASYVTGALWSVDGGITIGKGAVGKQTPSRIAEPPSEHLDLEHSHEGLKNKHTESAR